LIIHAAKACGNRQIGGDTWTLAARAERWLDTQESLVQS
jgi:hypothetical protein